MSLDEKIKDFRDSHQNPVTWLEVKDVKQFIKELKEALFDEAIKRELPLTDPGLDRLPLVWVNKHIDRLAGKGLI